MAELAERDLLWLGLLGQFRPIRVEKSSRADQSV